MKKIIVVLVSLLSLPALAQSQIFKADMKINNKRAKLVVQYDKFLSRSSFIKVDDSTYSINSVGQDRIEGRRLVQENGKTIVDENIIVMLNADSETKAELKELNPKVNCLDADDVAVLIGNNINMKVLVGCGKTN
jgi:hypothetical protein